MDVVGDKVYTVYNEDNKLKAKMFDGSNWVSLGDSIINNKGNNPTITVYNDTPYVLYHDSAYKSIVAKFTNNKWETVQTLTSDLSQYSDMIATNNGVYIAITNGKTTFMNEGKAYLKVFKLNSNTNKFEFIGNNIHTGYVVEPSLSESNGNVYVSYTDFLQNNKVFIQKYENNTWKNIEGINLSASRAVIEVTDKKLYLATTFVNGTNSSQVHVYENNKWTKLGEDVGGSEVTNLLIDVNGKIPYVAYVDSVKGCSIVKKINGDKWVQEGLNVSDENLSKLDFKISNNKAYVAINPTASKKLLIKSRQLEKLNTGQIVGVSGITLNKTALNLTIGASESLVATISPSNATNKDVEWTSSNTNVATVDTTGKVTGVSAGSATITVKTKDGSKVATCNVTVKNPVISVTGVTLNKTALNLVTGASESLVATISPSNATNKNVEWTSSNTNVATVDTTGKVKAISTGSAIITVKTKDGSKVATCNVTVKNPVISVTGVTLNKTALNLVTGASESLVATISPSNATNKDVEWTSSNTNVATVDTTGKVTGVSAGSATITVKTKDGAKVATCNVTVKNPIAINDINKHWAESTITDFISNGYINGYQDNTFRPNNSITRAEFIKIFNKYFGLNKKSGKTFKDTSTHWAKDEIDIAVTYGVINGYPDNTFKPNEPITREQAAKIISNYKKIEDDNYDKLNKYKDATNVSTWAKNSVEGVLEQGYMNGYSDNTFRPKNNITRAEAVVTLSRIKK